MKEKRIMISYPEMKLDAIAQSAKGDKPIEELLIESVDDLFKKTVPKDVQSFLNMMQEQKNKSRAISRTNKPDSEAPKATPSAPVLPSGGNSSANTTGNSFPRNNGN